MTDCSSPKRLRPPAVSILTFVYIFKPNDLITKWLLKSFQSGLVPDVKWVNVMAQSANHPLQPGHLPVPKPET